MNWDGNKWQDNDSWDDLDGGSYVPLISILVFAVIGFVGTGYHVGYFVTYNLLEIFG